MVRKTRRDLKNRWQFPKDGRGEDIRDPSIIVNSRRSTPEKRSMPSSGMREEKSELSFEKSRKAISPPSSPVPVSSKKTERVGKKRPLEMDGKGKGEFTESIGPPPSKKARPSLSCPPRIPPPSPNHVLLEGGEKTEKKQSNTEEILIPKKENPVYAKNPRSSTHRKTKRNSLKKSSKKNKRKKKFRKNGSKERREEGETVFFETPPP